MFNTVHHHHDNSTSYKFPDKIVVEENRAPTDESIRLAEEYLEKARRSIITQYSHTTPTGFEFNVIVSESMGLDIFNTYIITLDATINGKRFINEYKTRCNPAVLRNKIHSYDGGFREFIGMWLFECLVSLVMGEGPDFTKKLDELLRVEATEIADVNGNLNLKIFEETEK